MRRLLTIFLGVFTLWGAVVAGAAEQRGAHGAPELEKLGHPFNPIDSSLFGYTTASNGDIIAWAAVRSPEKRGMLGINLATGKSQFVDLTAYQSTVMICRTYENRVYAMVVADRRQGVFISYDPATAKRTESKLDGSARISYFMQMTGDITPDGKFFVGTYPQARLAWLDTRTGQVGVSERLSGNPKQMYLITVAADRNNGMVYAAAGLNTPEIISFNPATGKSAIILSLDHTGRASVETGQDGKVYARAGGNRYACTPEEAIKVEHLPEYDEKTANFKQATSLALPDGGRLVRIHRGAQLEYRNAAGETVKLDSDFEPVYPLIYSISPGVGGNIWLGSFGSTTLASFNASAAKPEFINYGKMSSGGTQIYWTLNVGDKTYASSYTGGYIDLLDIEHQKYKRIVGLSNKEEQERIFTLIVGPGSKIYGPTMPIKSILGGGILELDPATDKYTFYRNVIKLQSIRAIAAAGDRELFGVSDVAGGTSSIPVEKTAKIFLWDTESKSVVWDAAPIKTESCYLGAFVFAPNRAWTVGTSTGSLVVVNTAERKIERVIKVPGGSRPLGSASALGNRAFLFSRDSLLEVNLDSGEVVKVLSSPVILAKFSGSLHGTQAEYLAPDGTAFIGSESVLYRVKLK